MRKIIKETVITTLEGNKTLGRLEYYDNESSISLRGFSGRRSRHDFFYRYSSIEKAEEKATEYSDNLRHWEQMKIDRRSQDKKDATAFKKKLDPGTILTDSWGYDQTNVEFYKVISINAARTKVIIQKLRHIHKDSERFGSMACNVMPDVDNPYGPKIEKQIRSDQIKICSSISLHLWDGRPKYKSWYA